MAGHLGHISSSYIRTETGSSLLGRIASGQSSEEIHRGGRVIARNQWDTSESLRRVGIESSRVAASIGSVAPRRCGSAV